MTIFNPQSTIREFFKYSTSAYGYLIPLSFFLIVLTLAVKAIAPQEWGYDEFGAIISFLELDDPAFIAQYLRELDKAGITNSVLRHFFIYGILPIIVVPIRWTYALGISPWLGIARLAEVDWAILKPVLMLPTITLAALGFGLVLNVLRTRTKGPAVSLFFLAFATSSTPLFWWTTTLSSYSHHIFCFGILLHASLMKLAYSEARFFEPKSILISMAPIFNYQYVPLVGMLGLLDFFRGPRVFFASGRYRLWLMPFSVCAASAVFLYLRSLISNKHLEPTTASLPPEAARLFNFPAQAVDPTSAIQTLAARYLDIVHSFIVGNNPHFTVLSLVSAAAITILFLYFAKFTSDRSDRDLTNVLVAMTLGTVTLHLSGVLPMSPTRHQLVLFLPLCLFVALGINQLTSRWLSQAKISAIAFLVTLVFLINQVGHILSPTPIIPIRILRNLLMIERVERVVLLPCDLELLLFKDIRERYSPIYRCGPKMVHDIPDHVLRIGMFSMRPLSESVIKVTLSEYGDSSWTVKVVPVLASAHDVDFGNLYIAERSARGK